MLTRLYVDNYKCLVNFDLRLGREHLLMGSNGTGKSSVFEVLSALRRLHHADARVDDLFPAPTLTRWQSRSLQVFELEASLPEGLYRYRLEVEHDVERSGCRVQHESLHLEGAPLFTSQGGEAQLYRDGGSPGPKVLSDWSRSGLPFLHERKDNRKLMRFKQWSSRIHVVRAEPRHMSGRSEKEEVAPAEDLANFASWYRHLTQERLEDVVRLRDQLRQVLEGFDSLVLKSAGADGMRVLRTLWRREPDSTATDEYAFEELSDGQRALVGLYTLLHVLSDSEATLCLDEPDNFVALREIQPFLLELREREKIQALLISHHPEVINQLAPYAGLVFERVVGGPVRVSPFQAPAGAALPAAEYVARGWEDGK